MRPDYVDFHTHLDLYPDLSAAIAACDRRAHSDIDSYDDSLRRLQETVNCHKQANFVRRGPRLTPATRRGAVERDFAVREAASTDPIRGRGRARRRAAPLSLARTPEIHLRTHSPPMCRRRRKNSEHTQCESDETCARYVGKRTCRHTGEQPCSIGSREPLAKLVVGLRWAATFR